MNLGVVMDLSSHGIVALVRNDEGRFLLLKEARQEMQGCWAPPHGCLESSDKSEEAGVAREVYEETGLHVEPVKKIFSQAADTKVKTVAFWLVDVAGWSNLEIDKTESSDHGWFSLDEVLELKLYPGTRIFFEKVASGDLVL